MKSKKNVTINMEEYLDKLKVLPPLEKKTDVLVRTLASAMLDRIIEDYNKNKIKT